MTQAKCLELADRCEAEAATAASTEARARLHAQAARWRLIAEQPRSPLWWTPAS